MKKLNEYNGWFRQIRRGVPLVHYYILGISQCGRKIKKEKLYTNVDVKDFEKIRYKVCEKCAKKSRRLKYG